MPGIVFNVPLIEPRSPPRPELVSRLQAKTNSTNNKAVSPTLDQATLARKSFLDSTSEKARKANTKAAAVASQVQQQRREERARQEELIDSKIALAATQREVLQKQLSAKFDKRKFLAQSAREAREMQEYKKSQAFQSHVAALLKASTRKQAMLQAERERANSASKHASDVSLASKAAAQQQQARLFDECAARSEAAAAKRDALLSQRAECAAAAARHARQVAFEQQLLQASKATAKQQRCEQTLQEASDKRESFVAQVASKAAAVSQHAQEVCEAHKAQQQQSERKGREQLYQRLLVAQSNRTQQQQQQQSPGKTSRRSSAPSSPTAESEQELAVEDVKQWVLHVPMGRMGACAPTCLRVPQRSSAVQALQRLRMMQAAQTRRHLLQAKKAQATLRECRHVAASHRRHQVRQTRVLANMERHSAAQAHRVQAQTVRTRFALLWNARYNRVLLQAARMGSARLMKQEAWAVRCTMAETRRTVTLSKRTRAVWRQHVLVEHRLGAVHHAKKKLEAQVSARLQTAGQRRAQLLMQRVRNGSCSFARALHTSQLAKLARTQKKRQLRSKINKEQDTAQQRKLQAVQARKAAATASCKLACQFVVESRN